MGDSERHPDYERERETEIERNGDGERERERAREREREKERERERARERERQRVPEEITVTNSRNQQGSLVKCSVRSWSTGCRASRGNSSSASSKIYELLDGAFIFFKGRRSKALKIFSVFWLAMMSGKAAVTVLNRAARNPSRFEQSMTQRDCRIAVGWLAAESP